MENIPQETKPGDHAKFLAWGYKAAITIAFLGMILSSIYLFIFIQKSDTANIDPTTQAAYNTERKTVLLSTGVFVGMSFGFLGFGLFLIEAKGEVDAGGGIGEHLHFNFKKLSPGLFVILCATAIIIAAITHNIEYQSDILKFVKDPKAAAKRLADSTRTADSMKRVMGHAPQVKLDDKKRGK